MDDRRYLKAYMGGGVLGRLPILGLGIVDLRT